MIHPFQDNICGFCRRIQGAAVPLVNKAQFIKDKQKKKMLVRSMKFCSALMRSQIQFKYSCQTLFFKCHCMSQYQPHHRCYIMAQRCVC